MIVSVIIPTYNRPQLLTEAVASVLAQTYRPIEIIIVDDGSTDETPRVADDLARAHPDEIRVIHQPNRGVGLAREAGRLTARGEFIQYLDSDDLLWPEKFGLQVQALRARPECGVAYGKTRYYRIGDPATDQGMRRTGEQLERMFPAFLQARGWFTSTPLYRSSVTDAAGPWTGLRNEEDWEYDCRIAALGTRLCYCDVFVSDHRGHSGERLSHDGSADPVKLRDRARAHALILGHARRAGIEHDQPEMRHFARELFLLSRQCGAAGLADESRMLFELARDASGAARGRGWDFRLYRLLAGGLGWRRMGRLSGRLDRLRGVLSELQVNRFGL